MIITADQIPTALAQPFQTLRTPILMPGVPNPTTVTAPAPVEQPTSMPISGELQPPSVQALSGEPTPTRFGRFQDALAPVRALMAGTNDAAANDPNASAPGAWARHLIAGASKALSGGTTALGDVSTKPGGGALAGIAETLANRNQRMTAQKEYADKQAQLAKENERADKTFSLEQQKADDLHAYSMIQTLNTQKVSRNLDRDFNESQVKADEVTADMLRGAHREVLSPAGGISETEYEQNFGTGKKYDPSKTIPLHIGWTTTTKNGEEVIEPVWEIFSREHNQQVPVTKEGAEILSHGPADTRFKEGSVVDGDVLFNATRQVGSVAIAEESLNNSLEKLDAEHASAEKIKTNATDLATVGQFLSGEDFLGDIKKIVTHKNKDGSPAPEAQAGQRLLTNFFTKEEQETHRKNLADEENKRLEIAAKNNDDFADRMNKAGLSITDDMRKTFMNLPPDKRKVLGIDDAGNPDSKSPLLGSQVAVYSAAFGPGDLDFDKAFPQRLTKGASGMTAQQAVGVIKQLNPNWSEQQYRLTADAYKKIINGQDGKAIQQYNNVLKHGAILQDTADELSKSFGGRGVKFMNTALNAIETQFGGTVATELNTEVQAVRDEYTLLLSAGYKPSDEEQIEYRGIVSGSSTPNQISMFLKTVGGVGAVRLGSINERYKSISGQNIPGILSQDTYDAAKHLNLDPQAMKRLDSMDVGGTLFHNPNWKPASDTQIAQQNNQEQGQQIAQQAAGQVRAQQPAAALAVPSDLPPGVGIVQDRQGNKFWADPTTKKIYRPVTETGAGGSY